MFVWRNFKGKGKKRKEWEENGVGGAGREGGREKGKKRKKEKGGREKGEGRKKARVMSEKQTLEIRNYPRRALCGRKNILNAAFRKTPEVN